MWVLKCVHSNVIIAAEHSIVIIYVRSSLRLSVDSFITFFSPLKDLKSQNIDDFEYHLLTNFASLARKQKNDAEYVLAEFMKLLSDERYVCMPMCPCLPVCVRQIKFMPSFGGTD